MKLRNKKTGEIVRVKFLNTYQTDDGTEIGFRVGGTLDVYSYNSLTELNEEWEDYEEQKRSALDLMILTLINFIENEPDEDKVDLEDCKQMLEKLKAWKRLKGKIVGWSFSYDLDLNGCGFNDEDIVVGIKLPRNVSKKDLDLLFGGEE